MVVVVEEEEEEMHQQTPLAFKPSNIKPESAARENGTPFHAGAQRYYEEIGIWPSSTTPSVTE